jgi:hypothetical protein
MSVCDILRGDRPPEQGALMDRPPWRSSSATQAPALGFDRVMSKMDIKGVGGSRSELKKDINRGTEGQDRVQPI